MDRSEDRWEGNVQDMFSPAQRANQWADIYQDDIKNVEDSFFRARRDFAVDFVAKYYDHDDLILDLGCGAGPATKALVDREYQCIGIDLSHDMIALAAEELGSMEGPHHKLMQGPADDVPLADGSVSCVLNLGVISYSDRPEAIIREIHRVLRPGGRALITFRNYYNRVAWDPVEILRHLAGACRNLFKAKVPETLQIEYPGSFLKPALVEKAILNEGFHIEEAIGIGCGPLRWNGTALNEGAKAVKFDRRMTALLRGLGLRALHRFGSDVYIFSVRK